MIKVNNEDVDWEEGMSVEMLLNKLRGISRFTYIINSTTTVIINKTIISRFEYSQVLLNDGDHINIFPMLVGG